jgi:hypothetical protein
MPDVLVADARPYVQYACDGVQTVFTYPFPILAADDLTVVLDDGTTPAGVSVAGVGDDAGGTVTLSPAPTAGRTLTLFRDMPVARTTDFQEAGEFRASAINAELDRLTMMLQQVEALVGQTVKRAPEDADTALVLPPASARATGVLGFDADGLPSVATAPATAAATASAAADTATAAAASATAAATSASADAVIAGQAAITATDAQAAAEASAANAATDATAAQDAADNAEAWADTAEDTEIAPGVYSARHWAAKAQIASMSAERRRADLVAVRARMVAAVPAVRAMPVFALDAMLGAGADELSVQRSGTAHVTDAKGRLLPVAADTPRFDHDPVTGTPLGLLCEGARTNLLHDSFNPATQTRTLGAGTYTLSVRGSGSCVLSGGPSGTAVQGVPVTFTLAGSTAVTFTVSGVLAAFQCEAGQNATSPIETPVGGTATRSADLITLVDTAWYDPAGMSFVIEAHLADVPASGALRLFSLNDGTEANRHDLHYAGDQTRLMFFAKSGGSSQGNVDGLVGGWTDGAVHTIGVTVGGGQRTLFIDGVKASADTITEPVGATTVRIGRNHDTTPWQGHVRRLLAYPRCLSDADMSALTA